jgi:hypothetical protein
MVVIVLVSAVVLLAVTTLIHYEVLRLLNAFLPQLRIPNRTKLLLVIFASFVAHLLEMAIYGFGYFALVEYCNVARWKGQPNSHFPTASIFQPKPAHH